MGRHAHAFLAAADHDARVADAYRLGADRHGPQAGTAEPVDLVGGALLGATPLDGRLPGRVRAPTGREDLAQDGLVAFGPPHPCPPPPPLHPPPPAPPRY